MKFLAKNLAILVLGALAASCGIDVKGIRGSGNVTTETRNIVEPFTGIDASSGIEVAVSQGPQMVRIVADDNVQPHILTSVENGVLKIYSDYNSFIDVKSRKVIVTMPEIRSLESSSGVELWSTQPIRGESLRTKSSSGSEMKLEVEYDRVESESSSGSSVELRGKALKLVTSSSSGSSLDASDLMANDIESKSASGSTTTVHPLVRLDARASSGSSIDYTSNPKEKLKSDASSGGSVSKI